MDDNSSQEFSALYLDFAKTFNKVPHDRLAKTLEDSTDGG